MQKIIHVKTLEVVGTAHCADCKDFNFKITHAFSGLHVTIDCSSRNWRSEKSGSCEGFESTQADFNVPLPQELVEERTGTLERQNAYAQLHSGGCRSCPAHNGLEASKIVFKSQANGVATFGPSKKLQFSAALCTSKFFWPYFKFPPLPKISHPWKKNFGHPWFLPPFPPVYDPNPLPPPAPVYAAASRQATSSHQAPTYEPPSSHFLHLFQSISQSHQLSSHFLHLFQSKAKAPVHDLLRSHATQAKEPVYKPPIVKPLPPPVPVYKPKPPVIKPLPPPVPIYEPKPPVYVPPKKPCPPIKPNPPVYKPPVAKPLPPPVPIYKPPVVKPLPTSSHLQATSSKSQIPPPVSHYKPPVVKPLPPPVPVYEPPVVKSHSLHQPPIYKPQ
ncbi:Proline-rich protein 4 [Sesamum alatum]|uniref:Proline-rich protein 4 n=1 Tax=Sesamum alatum TaxID=300844 RepID=A0AAE2CX45_9LAMI|nr:Proline-rich protein 4 [Sesamum alatum]